MREHIRERDAAGAQPEQVHLVAARDVLDHLVGSLFGGQVVVQAPGSVTQPGIRVPPDDHEYPDALADGELGQRPPGRQIQDVVPVDLRRDHQQRNSADPGRGRRVLQQLEHLLPVDHGARSAGEVLADDEVLAVSRGGHPAARQITQHVLGAAHQRHAAGLGGLPQRGGVGAQVVGRGQRGRDDVGREPGARLLLPGRVHRLIHLAHPQLKQPVGLSHDAEVGDGPPRLVAEPLVTLVKRQIRLAERDLGQLPGQPRHLPGHRGRINQIGHRGHHVQGQHVGRCLGRVGRASEGVCGLGVIVHDLSSFEAGVTLGLPFVTLLLLSAPGRSRCPCPG